MIIFGASGDLTKRKLMPALYSLYRDKRLKGGFSVIGVGRTVYSDTDYRTYIYTELEQFVKPDEQDKELMFLKNRSINPVQFFRRMKIVSKRLFYNNPGASAIKMRFLQMQRNHPVERRGRSQIKHQIIRFFLIGNLLQTFH